jgi:hypothetical protein
MPQRAFFAVCLHENLPARDLAHLNAESDDILENARQACDQRQASRFANEACAAARRRERIPDARPLP